MDMDIEKELQAAKYDASAAQVQVDVAMRRIEKIEQKLAETRVEVEQWNGEGCPPSREAFIEWANRMGAVAFGRYRDEFHVENVRVDINDPGNIRCTTVYHDGRRTPNDWWRWNDKWVPYVAPEVEVELAGEFDVRDVLQGRVKLSWEEQLEVLKMNIERLSDQDAEFVRLCAAKRRVNPRQKLIDKINSIFQDMVESIFQDMVEPRKLRPQPGEIWEAKGGHLVRVGTDGFARWLTGPYDGCECYSVNQNGSNPLVRRLVHIPLGLWEDDEGDMWWVRSVHASGRLVCSPVPRATTALFVSNGTPTVDTHCLGRTLVRHIPTPADERFGPVPTWEGEQ